MVQYSVYLIMPNLRRVIIIVHRQVICGSKLVQPSASCLVAGRVHGNKGGAPH